MHKLKPQASTYYYTTMYRRSVIRSTQRQDRWTLDPKRYGHTLLLNCLFHAAHKTATFAIFLIKVRQVKEKEDAAERRCTNLTEANEKMKKEVRICTHNQM